MEFLIIVLRSSYIECVPDDHINIKNTLDSIKNSLTDLPIVCIHWLQFMDRLPLWFWILRVNLHSQQIFINYAAANVHVFKGIFSVRREKLWAQKKTSFSLTRAPTSSAFHICQRPPPIGVVSLHTNRLHLFVSL